MAYATVTNDTIRKNSFKNIYTLLQNVHADIGTNVYGSYPLKDVVLPNIVIENARINPSEEGQTLTALKTKEIVVLININSKQAETLDTYADAVDKKLRDSFTTLQGYGMVLNDDGIEDNGAVDFIDANNNRVHQKTLSVTFEFDV